jgi:hypothetical protein
MFRTSTDSSTHPHESGHLETRIRTMARPSALGRSPGTVLLIVALAVALAAAPASAASAPTLFGGNLIVNGDAEAGAASPDGYSVVPIPGWTTSGPLVVVAYGTDGGYPSSTDPGPTDRGENFFAGGPDNASSSATQLVNVAAAAYLIDSGSVTYDLAGYLGGWTDQGDNAVLRVTFKQGAIVLASAEIGPVTAADRDDETGLLEQSTSGFVPVGTRQILVTLQMTKDPTVGAYNDGYADNLSLVLTK